jgi:hypothetical protein
MSLFRAYNPLMRTKPWIIVAVPARPDDFLETVSPLYQMGSGIVPGQYTTYRRLDHQKYRARVNTMRDWCEERAQGRWSAEPLYQTADFFFKNRSDAMLFKLTWI